MHLPPSAAKISHTLVTHEDSREDPYYWLGNREIPEVIEYLETENRYAKEVMLHTQGLQDEVVKELTSRVVESDTSAPVKDDGYEYYYRDRKENSYLTHCRRKIGSLDTEEILIDENELAKGYSYFRLNALSVSPNHEIVGYGTDTTGDERCTIQFLRLADRQIFSETIENTSGNHVWNNHGTHVYYTTLNQANRPCRLFRHRLGDSSDKDQLLFEESDEAFYLHVSNTDSRRYISLQASSAVTTEVHLLDAEDDQCDPRLIFQRIANVEYSVEDRANDLYVLTNEDAVNFRFMKTSLSAPDKSNWETVIPHSEHITLTGFRIFRSFIAVSERFEGLPSVRILNESMDSLRVEKPAEIQELHIGDNREFDTSVCRLNGSSLVLPYSQYDCDMKTGELSHIKTRPVGGGYRPADYTVERHLAISHDGTKVPLYIVSKKEMANTKPAHVLLYAYGSYGLSYPLYFSSARLSLLERGIKYAVAHVRGGAEFGEMWYHDGKLLSKKNTFLDFSACANYLLDSGITESDKLAIEGGSAGGLVLGNYLNTNPGRCRVAVAHVPFVDILTTILDDSLPLSITERDEWGDPNDKEFYDYIKSYSPYDNVSAGQFPALYISAGLNDPRVGYWEPAKWTAKIRACKTDDNLLILRTEMHSGHGGKSGRYDKFRETSIEYAFIIDQLLADQNT